MYKTWSYVKFCERRRYATPVDAGREERLCWSKERRPVVSWLRQPEKHGDILANCSTSVASAPQSWSHKQIISYNEFLITFRLKNERIVDLRRSCCCWHSKVQQIYQRAANSWTHKRQWMFRIPFAYPSHIIQYKYYYYTMLSSLNTFIYSLQQLPH